MLASTLVNYFLYIPSLQVRLLVENKCGCVFTPSSIRSLLVEYLVRICVYPFSVCTLPYFQGVISFLVAYIACKLLLFVRLIRVQCLIIFLQKTLVSEPAQESKLPQAIFQIVQVVSGRVRVTKHRENLSATNQGNDGWNSNIQRKKIMSLKMKTMFRSQELWDLVETGFEDKKPRDIDQKFRDNRKKDAKALFFIQQVLMITYFFGLTISTSKQAQDILKQEYLVYKKVITVKITKHFVLILNYWK